MDTVTKPTALIEVLDAHGRIHARHRLTNVGDRCTIGRNLHCDLVLDDPFAATDHTSLTLLDDGRVSVTDLGSRNGTRVDSERNTLLEASSQTIADAHLVVGRTRIRVRTMHAALAPERVFPRDTLQRHRTALALFGVAAVIALAAGNEWLRETDQIAAKILMGILAALIGLSLWIGVWSLITRIGHGIWNLRMHAAIACNACAIGAAGFWLFDMMAFAMQWSWLVRVGAMIAFGATVIAIYLHLRIATQMNVHVAVIVATAAPLLLGSGAGWIYFQNEARNINHIELGGDVFPPQLRLTHGMNVNAYLANLASLQREAERNRQQSLIDTPLTTAK